jgi:hypothetical protein
MRISERFNLGATQYELDFIDIDTDTDIPLFVDPYFLSARVDAWSVDAVRTLRSFFAAFIGLVRNGQRDQARELFDHLHEPNETCLGLSRNQPRGNAIGDIDAAKLFESIVNSRAVATGIVEDLEDFRLFVPGIDKDKVSDMTTNILRHHLVKYTQEQCALWNIPQTPNVPCGFYWDRARQQWLNEYTEILIIDGLPILLTPKGIVSYAKRYAPQKYYRHFILNFHQHEQLRMNSALVQHRKDGSPYVTKISVKENIAPYSKEYLADFTARYPDVFQNFKHWAGQEMSLSNSMLTEIQASDVARLLINNLQQIPVGREHASEYHRLVIGILELIFYPDLISPQKERPIHQGRIRIDITFDNAATNGFFFRLHNIHDIPSQYIIVECKNYASDIANPELDQIAGRFSPNRGRFGIAVSRDVNDMAVLVQRCNDRQVDGHGTIVPLIDEDLITILTKIRDGIANPYETLLSDRFREITMA